MSTEWTVVLRGDWYLPHLVNMLDEYRGSNSEQRSCADEMIAQIREQMVPLDGDSVIKTTRPLAVIDPEDREAVERLALGIYPGAYSEMIDGLQIALREFADPKPPKDPEPTALGAVVRDGGGVNHVRIFGGSSTAWLGYIRDDGGECRRRWEDLPRPLTVLHAGWTGDVS